MLSVREQCVAAVAEQLATYTTGAGYSIDAGIEVYRCRASLPESLLPGLVLWDGPETATARFGVIEVQMELVAVLHVHSIARPDAGALLADLYACFAATPLVDTPIAALSYSGGTPKYPEDGSAVLQVESRWRCTYRYMRGDPYTPTSLTQVR